MRAILCVNGPWLWYTAGKYGLPKGIHKPKVDYLALKNEIVRQLGVELVRSIVYLTDKIKTQAFAKILEGFGYEVVVGTERFALKVHKDLAETSDWDAIIFAVGSLDVLPLIKKLKSHQKAIYFLGFGKLEKEFSDLADGIILLDQNILYNNAHTRR